jgi:hypothetical protein
LRSPTRALGAWRDAPPRAPGGNAPREPSHRPHAFTCRCSTRLVITSLSNASHMPIEEDELSKMTREKANACIAENGKLKSTLNLFSSTLPMSICASFSPPPL